MQIPRDCITPILLLGSIFRGERKMSMDIFKDKPKAFLDAIYANPLGKIRFENLTDDLTQLIKEEKINSILDMGSGSAPVTLSLLHSFPDLTATLVDPSAKLLEKCKEDQKDLSINEGRIEYKNVGLENYTPEKKFDLVICHAVANWTDDPFAFLDKLFSISQDSFISLLVGASTGKAIRFAHQGNIQDLITTINKPGSPVGSLIEAEKVRPLDPDEVIASIQKNNLRIIDKAAVRVFADYINPEILKDEFKFNQVKEAEKQARRLERYWKLGQLIHFILRK